MRSSQVSWRWYLCAQESPLYVLHPVSQVRLWHTDSLVQTVALTIIVCWCAATRWSCHAECLDCCCQDQNESMFTGRFSSSDKWLPRVFLLKWPLATTLWQTDELLSQSAPIYIYISIYDLVPKGVHENRTKGIENKVDDTLKLVVFLECAQC